MIVCSQIIGCYHNNISEIRQKFIELSQAYIVSWTKSQRIDIVCRPISTRLESSITHALKFNLSYRISFLSHAHTGACDRSFFDPNFLALSII